MRHVFKYSAAAQCILLNLPINAKCVLFDHQHQQPQVWFEVDDREPVIERQFVIYGTGHDIQDGDVHIMSNIFGQFVWHLYERS